YYKLIKRSSSIVPGVEIDLLKRSIDCILELTDKGLLKSCHDVSEGGIGVCISEMLIGGNIGAKIDLSRVSPGLRSDFKLFSESNTRWVVEIEKKDVKRFENIVKKHDLLLYKIGYVEGERLEIIDGVKKVIDLGVSEITEKWHDYMWGVMG
ncbi:MAG: phosphoribosylformylglycinamidine synthase II, partial [Thermoplasmata archaeon]